MTNPINTRRVMKIEFQYIPRFFAFLAAGVPGLLVAEPFDYAFADLLHLPRWVPYAQVQRFDGFGC